MSFLGSLFSGPSVQSITGNAGVQNANTQAQNTINQQQNFVNALAGQNGIQNQSGVFNQLQGVANGTGPNPAQAMLAQQTGQNVANQAALMAGQRGVNQNPGLLAREAAQQGAATQQQAVGQGTTLQANQSLNALGQLSGIAGQQVAQQQAGIDQQASMNQAQQNALANQISGYNQASQNAYSSQLGGALGAIGGIGAAIPGISSLFKSATPAVPAPAAPAPQMAEGGPIYASSSNQMSNMKENYSKDKKFTDHFAEGGTAKNMKTGGHVPGKPKVGGAKNDYANDTVPAMLSPGEWVIPRSVTQAKDPKAAAARFVDALLKKKGK